MKQLTFGVRSLAVLATSSAVAFATPVTWFASGSGYSRIGASEQARPAAARTSPNRFTLQGGDGTVSLFDLDDASGLLTEPTPGGMKPGETPAAVRNRRCAGDVACFLVCTRAHESDTGDSNGRGMFDAGYGAVSEGGSFRGAYQFLRSTWNSSATAVGRDDLVGHDPAEAAPRDQDLLAGALYSHSGNEPWGGRC